MPEFTINQATIQRVSTLETKGGGYAILLTCTNAISDEALVRLNRGRGSVVRATFEVLQHELLPGDDVNAGVPPTTERVWETASGDMVKAHVYQSTSGDERCDLCGWGTSHECHAQAAIDAQRLVAQGDRLIADVEQETDPERAAGAAAQELTPDQTEARTALASRSRIGRNGAA